MCHAVIHVTVSCLCLLKPLGYIWIIYATVNTTTTTTTTNNNNNNNSINNNSIAVLKKCSDSHSTNAFYT